jgi:hypothetical protein
MRPSTPMMCKVVSSKSGFGTLNMHDQISFLDAELKIERANQHIRDLELWIARYLDACPYSVGVDADPQTGQPRLYIIAPPIEADPLAAIVGDAAHNLRAALDYMAIAILRPFGNDPKTASFPIDQNRQSLVTQPRYREIERVAPDIAQIIADFVGPNGRQFVGLNHLDRIDKHRLLITTIAMAKVQIVRIDDENHPPGTVSVPPPFLFLLPDGMPPRSGSAADFHNKRNGKAAVEICFGEGEPFENEPVIPTLIQLSELVSGIGQTLKAHIQGGNVVHRSSQ